MTRTAKTTATKPATTKGKVKVEVQETARDNRYVRASKRIILNLSIDVATLSSEAQLSASTARHTLEAWNGVVGVLLQHGAISQTWRAKLSPKSEKEPTPVATAK